MPKPRSSGPTSSKRTHRARSCLGQLQQAGDAVQRSGLAAARRAEQGDELAPLDRQGHIAQRVMLAEVTADAFQPQFAEISRDNGMRNYLPARAPTC